MEECGGDPGRQWEALSEVLNWLREYGVPPGSIASMSWNLFRASLSAPVQIGFDPIVARTGFYGGRQEARVQTDAHGRAKVYSHMVSADIRSAYAHSMASVPYGLSLRPMSPTTTLDPSVPGLAEARVDVPPDMPFGPLPVRLSSNMIQFQKGPIHGVWPWVELDAARNLGCDVRIDRSWGPRATLDLFGPWYRMVASADLLGPGATTLAKAVRNSLWGQFAMSGEERGMLRWADDRGNCEIHIDKEPRKMPHAWTTHIAAETTARVRARLLAEGLYGGDSRGWPVHADTDGVVVRKSRELPSPQGGDPGHWRVKAAMRRVDIRAPQLYRWQCPDCSDGGPTMTRLGKHPPWHYVAAGVPEGSARQVFERDGSPPTPVAHRSVFDVCLPGVHSQETELIRKLMAEARGVAGVA